MDDAAPFGTYAPRGFVRRAIETTRSLPDTWLARRLVILVRRLVVSRLRGSPVDVEALGARMRVYPYSNICDKRMLFNPQTFDPHELALLRERLSRGFVFIDIGANIGAYSLFVASQAGGSARVLAVEPQPRMFDRLVQNIRLNAFANIKALDLAIADKDGEVTLFLDARNSGESSVKIVPFETANQIRVRSRTLLGLIRDEGLDRVDAVKLDVEGAEDLILEPFLSEAPTSLRPQLLIIEDGIGRWQIELPELLGRYGYRQIAKTRLNLVFERVPDERP